MPPAGGIPLRDVQRLNSSPLGSYTCAHLHAATAGSSSYSASYDAAGGTSCRATSGATTCAGTTPTGAQLTYDAERRLQHWQSTPSSPTATDDYLYDGAGQRIQKLSASGGTSTLTSYIGGGSEEAQSVNGGAATLTKYLGAPGLPQAIRVGTVVSGTLSYLASDGLSSVSEALDSSSGTVTAQQLYAPYGGTYYSNRTLPGAMAIRSSMPTRRSVTRRSVTPG